MAQLADMPLPYECFSLYLSTFAFGSSAACTDSTQIEKLQSGEIGIKQAFAELVNSPTFTQRKGQ